MLYTYIEGFFWRNGLVINCTKGAISYDGNEGDMGGCSFDITIF